MVERIEFRQNGPASEVRQSGPRVDVRVTAGPAGATGADGPAGDPDDLSFVHVQTVPSATWEFDHPLPFRPTVQITDSAQNVVFPDNIRHTLADTHIQVTFTAVFSGEASCT